MTLIKYNPESRNLIPGSFINLFDKFFYDSLEDSSVRRFLPQANIIETDKNYELHLAVPGMKKDDFKIEMEDGKLVISGERNYTFDENSTVHRKEILYGSFNRVFQMPEDVNHDKISASYVDGILAIVIPKDEKKILKHKITVK